LKRCDDAGDDVVGKLSGRKYDDPIGQAILGYIKLFEVSRYLIDIPMHDEAVSLYTVMSL